MKIVFQNECNERILVCVENCTVLEIHPKQQCAKEIEDTDVLAIGVHFRRESSVKKREYILVLDTQYVLKSITDGEVIRITREKSCIHPLPAYYDRLFLKPNRATILCETHTVTNAQCLKSQYDKNMRVDHLLIDPLSENIVEAIILFAIGFYLTIYINWKIAIVFFPSAYCLLLFTNWLGRIITQAIFKKATVLKSEKEEFMCLFESESINSYYADPNRHPLMGRVEH